MLNLIRDARDFLAYLRFRSVVRNDWRLRHRKVFALNPGYRMAAPQAIEQEHQRLWRKFDRFVRLDTLRICSAISGTSDARIIPEEIFATDIERRLNSFRWAEFLSHKSFYRCLFEANIFPHCYLHCIAGQFYDSLGCPLTPQEVRSIALDLAYPVVMKPNTGSSGGRGVTFPASAEELVALISGCNDFVVQEVLTQHMYFNTFNSHGLNTIRVYTYKSVKSGIVHVLNAALRMGRGGSLDNETDGGIVCYIQQSGQLNAFALDKYGAKFESHPDSGVCFAIAAPIPKIEEMYALASDLADRLPMMAVAGWDMSLDSNGTWRVIEVNLKGNTIRFAQYAGQPFLGEHTEEVVSYCLTQPQRRRMEA